MTGITELTIIKGVIADMPEDHRVRIIEAGQELEAVIRKHGDLGKMALALVGAKYAEEE